jgi:membrane protein implicated in regulation of membrane protease activity
MEADWSVATWQLLTLIGIILIILEVFVPGFILLPIGVAFVVTAVFSYFIDSLSITLAILAVNCGLIFVILRKYFRRTKSPDFTSGVDSLIGQKAKVTETINNDENSGYVKVYSDNWRALSADDSIIEAGTEVTIEKVDGNKVIVKM